MIEVEHLWKVYDTVEAVRDLSFTVSAGEVLGLVGPNGAGKTSTMRCLCGIIPPSAGEIRVCGVSMFASPVEAKGQVAFVPSEPRYFPYLTVWEHLQMFARLYNCGDQSERAEALIEMMSLTDKRDHLPESLSRGMQQKLMIGCALIHRPQVLIFDEPFTGLDPLAIRSIRGILRQCADEGAAVLLSSHLLAMVEDMVDGVLIIQNGQKVAHGALDTLITTMPTLREDADLEEIFLHATGSELRGDAKEEPLEDVDSGALEELASVGESPVGAVDNMPPTASTQEVGALFEEPSDVVGGEGGALPVSSSELLPQYMDIEPSQASLDALDAVPGKWFSGADEAGSGDEPALDAGTALVGEDLSAMEDVGPTSTAVDSMDVPSDEASTTPSIGGSEADGDDDVETKPPSTSLAASTDSPEPLVSSESIEEERTGEDSTDE